LELLKRKRKRQRVGVFTGQDMLLFAVCYSKDGGGGIGA
jgi:hypothetical protein